MHVVGCVPCTSSARSSSGSSCSGLFSTLQFPSLLVVRSPPRVSIFNRSSLFSRSSPITWCLREWMSSFNSCFLLRKVHVLFHQHVVLLLSVLVLLSFLLSLLSNAARSSSACSSSRCSRPRGTCSQQSHSHVVLSMLRSNSCFSAMTFVSRLWNVSLSCSSCTSRSSHFVRSAFNSVTNFHAACKLFPQFIVFVLHLVDLIVLVCQFH